MYFIKLPSAVTETCVNYGLINVIFVSWGFSITEKNNLLITNRCIMDKKCSGHNTFGLYLPMQIYVRRFCFVDVLQRVHFICFYSSALSLKVLFAMFSFNNLKTINVSFDIIWNFWYCYMCSLCFNSFKLSNSKNSGKYFNYSSLTFKRFKNILTEDLWAWLNVWLCWSETSRYLFMKSELLFTRKKLK